MLIEEFQELLHIGVAALEELLVIDVYNHSIKVVFFLVLWRYAVKRNNDILPTPGTADTLLA